MNFLTTLFEKNPTIIYHLSFFRDIVLIVQFLVLIIYLIITKKFFIFKFFVLLLIIGYIISFCLALIVDHPRPLTYYFDLDYFSSSFPSKHTMLSTFMSLIFFYENYLLFFISISFLFLIVYLSWFSLLHWPVDIIGGFVLALIIFYFLNFFQRFNLHNFQKKRQEISEENNKS